MRDRIRASLTLLALAIGTTSAVALELVANRPIYQGPVSGRERLDNCYMLGRNCGQDAADKFCQIEGMERAARFELEKVSPTRTLVGQRCSGQHCVAFKSIVCFASGKRGARTAYPVLIGD